MFLKKKKTRRKFGLTCLRLLHLARLNGRFFQFSLGKWENTSFFLSVWSQGKLRYKGQERISTRELWLNICAETWSVPFLEKVFFSRTHLSSLIQYWFDSSCLIFTFYKGRQVLANVSLVWKTLGQYGPNTLFMINTTETECSSSSVSPLSWEGTKPALNYAGDAYVVTELCDLFNTDKYKDSCSGY